MRWGSILVDISATPRYFLAFTVVLTVAFHLILIKWAKLSNSSWKRVDYLWLAATALGLVGNSAAAERLLSKNYLNTFDIPATTYSYNRLRSIIEDLARPDSGACAPRVRSPSSPPNFDEMVRGQKELCQDARSVLRGMAVTAAPDYPPLEKLGFVPLTTSDDVLRSTVAEINRLTAEYAQQRSELLDHKRTSEPSDSDDVQTVLSPLMFAIAVALRLAKVSGELSNSKAADLTRSGGADHREEIPATKGQNLSTAAEANNKTSKDG